jgi:hypothetical protein
LDFLLSAIPFFFHPLERFLRHGSNVKSTPDFFNILTRYLIVRILDSRITFPTLIFRQLASYQARAKQLEIGILGLKQQVYPII